MKYGWLTKDLLQEVRDFFEPRYKRKLSDNEIVLIAENLTGVIEAYLKMEWNKKYETAK